MKNAFVFFTMKVSLPKSDQDLKGSPKKGDNIPPLKLEKEERKLLKDQMVTFKLHTEPTQANSTTYELAIQILQGDEAVRAAIQGGSEPGRSVMA